MAVTFVDIMNQAAEIGVFTHYLPFVIVFTVFYAILAKTNILGERMKKLNMVISLVASLYVMTMGGAVGMFFTSLFSGASIILVAMLVFMMFLGLIIGDQAWDTFRAGRPLQGLVLFGLIIAAFLFFSSGGSEIMGLALPGEYTNVLSDMDQSTMMILGTLIFTALVIWWMIGGQDSVKKIQLVGL